MINAETGASHSRGTFVGTNGDSKLYRESSPLQVFVKAKKKINDIFVEINDYVQDSSKYVLGKWDEGNVLLKVFSNNLFCDIA